MRSVDTVPGHRKNRPVLFQYRAQFRDVNVGRSDAFFNGERRPDACRFSHVHTLRHDPDGRKRLLVERRAPSGKHEIRQVGAHERTVRDPERFPDGPEQGRAVLPRVYVDFVPSEGDGILPYFPGEDAIGRESVDAGESSGLSDAKRRGYRRNEAVLKPRHVFTESFGQGGYLKLAVQFGVGQ